MRGEVGARLPAQRSRLPDAAPIMPEEHRRNGLIVRIDEAPGLGHAGDPDGRDALQVHL